MSGKTMLEKAKKEVKEMEKVIAEYDGKESELRNRIASLSAKGAVLIPSFFFGIALLISALGIYYYPETIIVPTSGKEITYTTIMLLAVGFIIGGLVFLWLSLKAIEKASLETPTYQKSSWRSIESETA